jgi:hypothetical protein
MLRYFRSSVIALVLGLGAVYTVMAQTDGNISWKMAFLKGDIVNQAAQDLSKPIEMKNGDKFQLFMQIVDPQAQVYILFSGIEGTVDVLAQGTVPGNTAWILPSSYETLAITPPGGTERLYVIVTQSRQEKLERLLSMRKRDTDAILDEVRRIQQSESAIAEVPQKPVPIGGVVRGGMEALPATQFEGHKTYVQILRIVH